MKFNPLIFKIKKIYQKVDNNDQESKTKVENIRRDDGTPLSIILWILLIICCSSWTLTFWFAAKKPDSCPNIPNHLRFDCHPDGWEINQESCLARGCCWNPPNSYQENRAGLNIPLDVPYCYYPEGYSLYNRMNSSSTKNEETHIFENIKSSGFPRDISNLVFNFTCFDKDILRIRIGDKSKSRYEVPFINFDNKPENLDKCQLEFILSDSTDLRFQVKRKTTGEVLFDTVSAGALIFSDQFLQISSTLSTKFVYGLGEHRKPFLKDVNWKQFSFWNADQWPRDGATNLYGSHPFYLNMNPETGNGYGMLWLNSNAMEAILQPTPAITLRSLGGIFDLFFIAGPSPSAIVSQYTKIVGKTFLPPYWSLGYHQCKFDYGSLDRTKQILKQTQDAGIPIDVQWNDIDYMQDHLDFTYSKSKYAGLPEFVDYLHKNGLHYIPIIDPAISSSEKLGTYKPYEIGLEMNVFIQNMSGDPFEGRVWTNGKCVWPDFTNPKGVEYWTQMMKYYHDQVPIDGVWIDMNEPSNFFDGQHIGNGCENDPLNHPPYVPRSVDGQRLYHKTVCPSAKQHLGSHYDLHNLYGYSEGIATNIALKKIRQKRPFIISRSTFPGYGHFGGHWTGDVLSDWSSLHDSVTGIMNFNLFGIPMVGADICGFNGNTTAKLCQRWMEFGAFYPFSRNHNTDNGIDQDPVSLGPEVVKSAKSALSIRYALLPYLYSLFVKSHLFGNPVITPMFFHAKPGDQIAYYIDNQMFWGSDLLIVPALSENQNQVQAYLPSGEVWYDLRSLTKVEIKSIPNFVTLDAAPGYGPGLLVKGGAILPTQTPGIAKTTLQSQSLPFEILVFLDENQLATGEIYWDDGDSLDTYENGYFTHIKFECNSTEFDTETMQNSSLLPIPKMHAVIITGLNKKPDKVVTVNGQELEDFMYDTNLKILKLDNLNVDMTVKLTMKWQ